jgi:hypothetical protein
MFNKILCRKPEKQDCLCRIRCAAREMACNLLPFHCRQWRDARAGYRRICLHRPARQQSYLSISLSRPAKSPVPLIHPAPWISSENAGFVQVDEDHG